MKKVALLVIVAAVLAGLGVAAWRMGWLTRSGDGGVPAAVGGGAAAGTSAAGGQAAAPASGPGASATPGELPAAEPGAAAPATPGGPADAAADTGLPPFDGNIAAHEWGGKMESATDVPPDDDRVLSCALRGCEMGGAGEGPVEYVISFWGREPALIDRVEIVATENATPRNVAEVWTSMAGPTTGFSRVASETLPGPQSSTIRFAPVETRFVKVRIVGERFNVNWLKVFEAERAGYVPLLTRRRDVMGPLAPGAAQAAPPGAMPACGPGPETPPVPGRRQSRKVLVVSDLWVGPLTRGGVPWTRIKDEDPKLRLERSADLAIFGQVDVDVVVTNMARPWHLAESLGYDTVVIEQVGDLTIPLAASFKKALAPWVAAGHKLIIQDSDKQAPPSYDWLPYRFKANSPGAAGAPGQYLRILEDNWMVHNRSGVPGFIDAGAWERDERPYINELGDTNTVIEWDPRWCGHITVRNVNNVYGFGAAYARYGRGLILYNGFDIDMSGTPGYDILIARELAQGFDPDNLPCSARLGNFVVTTDTRLLHRALTPGRSVTYPLILLSNQQWKGDVTLSATAVPAVPGVEARFEPATVAVSDLHQVGFTLTVPPAATQKALAVEVKGTAADGKTNTLCLQLGPPRGGELSVVSALAPPSKTRKNLEIILDASGSMKALMGKKSRWDTALATLDDVLSRLPDDFNVGLRVYGHREASSSPKTCTDSELVVPIQPLDRQTIVNAASQFKPRGETPLVYSALQAPADLKALGGGTVILITDGGESCKGDPVKAATDLKASGLDMRLNIVGFAVTDPVVQKTLTGFAQASGGRFYAAQSGQALADALLIAAIEKFPYEVFDMAGRKVVEGEAGSPPNELPPGDYKVVVKAGAKELVAPRVRVTLGQQATVKIVLKGDQLVLE